MALLLRTAVQFHAVAIKERSGPVRASAFALPLYWALMMAEQRLEKREAQRLRLTPETAPRISLDMSFTAAQLTFSSAARLRGFTIVEPTPPVALAQQIAAEIDRRRSWRAALADGEGLEPTTISHSSS